MSDEVNAPPEPPAAEGINGQWALPSHSRKKMARKISVGLRKAYQEHQCNGNCNHVHQWGQRISKHMKQERVGLRNVEKLG
eukprot:3156353-Pyramimonas_sp.AAC.1